MNEETIAKVVDSFTCRDDFYSDKFKRIFVNAEKKSIAQFDILKLTDRLQQKAKSFGIGKTDFTELVKASKETEKTDEQSQEKEIPSNMPEWVIVKSGKDGVTFKINEPLFADWFEKQFNVVQISESFYIDGEKVDDGKVLQMIQEQIEPYIIERTGVITGNIIKTVGNSCRTQQPDPDIRKIYCSGGVTLNIGYDGTVTPVEEDVFTLTRLPVRYNPDADCPVFRDKYLADLFFPEDIPALQEYIGYCLIPCTKAQKGMFIFGEGGEGKTTLGTVTKKLFGHAAVALGVHKLGERFELANTENKLVLIDDDMKTELLSETNIVKQLITAESQMTVEEKGKQRRETYLYSRIFAIGNRHIGSKFDHSEGFYRRQLVIDVRPKHRTEQEDDPFMSEKCCDELEGILVWALEGLQRLIRNNFRFTVSNRMEKRLEETRLENNNVLAFVKDDSAVNVTGMFCDYTLTSDLVKAYLIWCGDNGETPVKDRTFTTRMAEMFREQKSNKVPTGRFDKSGKQLFANGYYEILLTEDLMQRVSQISDKELESLRRRA